MEIQSIQPTASQQEANKPSAVKGITRDDFLKLLIVQLQNQDPMKPLDNQEFAAQLATFNSLEQLMGINEKLKTLESKQLVLNQLGATSLIGKEIITYGNKLSLKEGSETPVRYELSADSTRVVVNLFDVNGELVRVLELGSQKAGEQTTNWDGRDRLGRPLPTGIYGFEINAFDAAGKKVAATGRVQGLVTGVNLEGSEPLLEIGDLRVPVSVVTGIR